MPIKGLSDRRRLPRLGKFHLGVKVKNAQGKEYPRAVDYFVLPYEPSDPSKLSPLGQQIAKAYGTEKPRELDVFFPVEDPEQVFPQSYKCYRSGVGLWCRGDGETAQRVKEGAPGMDEIPCPGSGGKTVNEKGEETVVAPCPFFAEKKCKAMANLMVLLPRVSMGGVFQIDTSSVNSIIDINSAIDMARATVGRISCVPFKLRVGPRQCAVEGKKKIVFTMTLSMSTFDEAKALLGQLSELRLLVNGGKPLALPPPVQDKFEETDLIPESVQTGSVTVITPGGTTVDPGTGEIMDGGEPDDLDIGDEADDGQPVPPAAPARPAAPRQTAPARPAGPAKPSAVKRSGVSF